MGKCFVPVNADSSLHCHSQGKQKKKMNYEPDQTIIFVFIAFKMLVEMGAMSNGAYHVGSSTNSLKAY